MNLVSSFLETHCIIKRNFGCCCRAVKERRKYGERKKVEDRKYFPILSSSMTLEQRRLYCIAQLSDGRHQTKLMKTENESNVCNLCLKSDDFGVCFLGENTSRSPCRGTNICVKCVLAITDNYWFENCRKKPTLPCFFCYNNCISDVAFPDENDPDYKLKSVFIALFWTEGHMHSNKVWISRKTELCNWIWKMNSTILLGCLHRDNDGSFFHLIKGIIEKQQEHCPTIRHTITTKVEMTPVFLQNLKGCFKIRSNERENKMKI